MRSSTAIWIFLSILSLLLLFSPLATFGRTVLKVGVYDNKPMLFPAENSGADGLFIDILEHIARQEGWRLEYVHGHWEEVLSALQNGEIDLLPVIAYSEEREKLFSYSDETIMANWAEIYTAKDSRLSSLLELEGQRVAVKMKDIHFSALKQLTRKFDINCRFIETDGYQTIFEMLDSAYLDIGVVNRMHGRANRENYEVEITPLIFNPIELRYGAPKGRNLEILAIIDNYLRSSKNSNNSFYHQAIEHWLMTENPNTLPGYFPYLLGGIITIALLLFGVNLLLRYQVVRQTRTLISTNHFLSSEIEKRQQAMKELQKYARVVEASSNAIALFDRDNQHLLVNNAYLTTFSCTRDSLRDLSLKSLVGEKFFAGHLKEPIQRCLTGQQTDQQLIFSQPGQPRRHWHMTCAPYQVAESVISGYTIDIRDITHQVELENQLKHSQKMEAIGMLAGGVAHDLNNILSGLVSYPDMLLVGRPSTDPMVHPLKIIKKSGQRAASIVADLLTLARRGVDNVKPVNLNTIIRDFLASPEHDLLAKSAHNIEYTTNLTDELLNIQGSATHLSKCLMNLFTNGLEAMTAGGTLTIATYNHLIEEYSDTTGQLPPGEYTVLSVADTGVGMSEETISHIFEPFYSSKVMGRSGTGLGMAVVWGTVKDHRGFIHINSAPGKGTTFILYFPTTRDVVAESCEYDLQDFRGNGESILVVDDLEEQRTFATAILSNLGYTVATAESGETAVTEARQHQFDLIVLDMIMPGGMNGLSTYKNILEHCPQQKAIIASGFSDTGDIAEAQKLGAGTYVKKPYTVLSLGRAVKEELQGSLTPIPDDP